MKLGTIEVICGPMFAGKTEELLRRVRRLEYAHKKVVSFKPRIDNRYEEDYIVSHNLNKTICVQINKSSDMIPYLDQELDAIVIDEFQFLDSGAIDVALAFKRRGVRVIVTGLDRDFKGEPFNNMPEILAYADSVTKLTAICVKCGEPATCTQRIVDGKPANYNDPLIVVGASENYEARCASCHEVPGKIYKYDK